MIFIHGWHNNARPDNGNLQSFNQLLKQLAKRVNTEDTEVMGVFIGWRGLAIERQWDKTGIGWLARHLTFYSRKDDTDLVAGIPLTKSLYSLASEAHARGGRVIFIGHSFGGRILEKALAQAIVGQTAADPGAGGHPACRSDAADQPRLRSYHRPEAQAGFAGLVAAGARHYFGDVGRRYRHGDLVVVGNECCHLDEVARLSPIRGRLLPERLCREHGRPFADPAGP